MFKLIKECIIEPFKEGREEARIEAEQEKKEQDQTNQEILASLTYTEMFAASLAAPFRVSVFLDWFSLFKKEDSEEQPIVHLLCFGEIANLDEEDIKRLNEQLETSFNISSGEEVLSAANASLQLAGIQLSSLQEAGTLYEVPHQRQDFSALGIGMASMLLVAAVDNKLLQKHQVLSIFEELIPEVQERFEGWPDYGIQLLAQEARMKFNKGFSRKRLEKDINNLIHKRDSPWQHVKWNP